MLITAEFYDYCSKVNYRYDKSSYRRCHCPRSHRISTFNVGLSTIKLPSPSGIRIDVHAKIRSVCLDPSLREEREP